MGTYLFFSMTPTYNPLSSDTMRYRTPSLLNICHSSVSVQSHGVDGGRLTS
jgi:hypothetical protein